MEGGGVGHWAGYISVNWEDEKKVCPSLLQGLLEKFYGRGCNNGSRELITESISRPSSKRPTLFFGSGSNLGVPCRDAVQGRAEWEGEEETRINIKEIHEYLECGYQVSPKSSSLQGMKARPLQSLLMGEVTRASYQP